MNYFLLTLAGMTGYLLAYALVEAVFLARCKQRRKAFRDWRKQQQANWKITHPTRRSPQ